MTHSLGSRVVTDAFQEQAKSVRGFVGKTAQTPEDRKRLENLIEVLRNKQLRVYMLANQLPLLQLGTPLPPIVGQIDAYCRPGGNKYDERYMAALSIIAFSDPNDVLS